MRAARVSLGAAFANLGLLGALEAAKMLPRRTDSRGLRLLAGRFLPGGSLPTAALAAQRALDGF